MQFSSIPLLNFVLADELENFFLLTLLDEDNPLLLALGEENADKIPNVTDSLSIENKGFFGVPAVVNSQLFKSRVKDSKGYIGETDVVEINDKIVLF